MKARYFLIFATLSLIVTNIALLAVSNSVDSRFCFSGDPLGISLAASCRPNIDSLWKSLFKKQFWGGLSVGSVCLLTRVSRAFPKFRGTINVRTHVPGITTEFRKPRKTQQATYERGGMRTSHLPEVTKTIAETQWITHPLYTAFATEQQVLQQQQQVEGWDPVKLEEYVEVMTTITITVASKEVENIEQVGTEIGNLVVKEKETSCSPHPGGSNSREISDTYSDIFTTTCSPVTATTGYPAEHLENEMLQKRSYLTGQSSSPWPIYTGPFEVRTRKYLSIRDELVEDTPHKLGGSRSGLRREAEEDEIFSLQLLKVGKIEQLGIPMHTVHEHEHINTTATPTTNCNTCTDADPTSMIGIEELEFKIRRGRIRPSMLEDMLSEKRHEVKTLTHPEHVLLRSKEAETLQSLVNKHKATATKSAGGGGVAKEKSIDPYMPFPSPTTYTQDTSHAAQQCSVPTLAYFVYTLVLIAVFCY